MPSPWEKTPQQSWADSFERQVSVISDRIQDATDDYQAGVEQAFERAGADVDVDEVSQAVEAFEEQADNFTEQAMKRATAVAAALYLETQDNVDVDFSGEDASLGDVQGKTDYDDTNGSDDEFRAAVLVLAEKFVQNWAQSYQA